jgi:hypothetical protein
MVINNNKQYMLSVMEQFSCYPWRVGVQTQMIEKNELGWGENFDFIKISAKIKNN